MNAVLSLTLLAAVAALPTVAHAAPTEAVTVTALATGTGVAARQLQGERTHFAADGGKVWAHLTVANPGAPTTVTLVWARDGVERWRIALDVGQSPRWRTWARRTVRARDQGVWSLTALDPAGVVLASTEFVVEAPPGPARAAR